MIKKKTISNRLQLLDFFKDMKNYVIVRIDDIFPRYKYSDDVDILTTCIYEIKNHILKIGQNYPDFHIKVSHGSGGKNHLHIDFFYQNETTEDFRFDIIGNISDFYQTLNSPHNYINTILSKKVKKLINQINIYVPYLSHELELRYLEYITKIDKKPDKIKHLKYINQFPDVKFNKYHI